MDFFCLFGLGFLVWVSVTELVDCGIGLSADG